jgi:hypothetical protein
MSVGLDLTELEFDAINSRVKADCNADGFMCDNYAIKTMATDKGYWMQICEGYEKYFSQQELASAVEYVEITENEEIILFP